MFFLLDGWMELLPPQIPVQEAKIFRGRGVNGLLECLPWSVNFSRVRPHHQKKKKRGKKGREKTRAETKKIKKEITMPPYHTPCGVQQANT